MRPVLALLLGLSTLAPSVASATEGLAWKWEEGQSRTYQVKADLKLSEWLVFKADNNSDLRVAELLLGVTTTCTPADTIGKHGWELHCSLDDVQIEAAPTKSDAGKLKAILDEMDEKFADAHIQMVFSDDGRLKNLDLEGIDRRNRRINEMLETTRLVLARAFAAFDLQLPKKGDDKGKGSWTQTGTVTMNFPSEYGTMGTSDTEHQIIGTEGSVVEIQSDGHGILGTGEMITVRPGAPERPKNQFDMNMRSLATFDTAAGTLIERQYLIEGTPTASSMAAEGGAGVNYIQAVRLVLIPEGEEAPKLGENAEITPERAVP